MNNVIDEKELKKAWLKRKFLSFDYHEEMLENHAKWLEILKRHWARPDIKAAYPDEWGRLTTKGYYNFDNITKPGEISRAGWKPRAGTASAITYNFNRAFDDFLGVDPTAGMTDAEALSWGKIEDKTHKAAHNIQYTIDNLWEYKGSDDYILDEQYTGPIDWPPNWREDIANDLGVNLNAPNITRCEANQPCPQAGFWWTHAKEHSRRYFQQNEIMPNFPNSAYGKTIWQWDVNQ